MTSDYPPESLACSHAYYGLVEITEIDDPDEPPGWIVGRAVDDPPGNFQQLPMWHRALTPLTAGARAALAIARQAVGEGGAA